VCGGCLSGPAAARFKQLVEPAGECPGMPGSQVSFVIGSYRLTCHPAGATWIVPRAEMDDCLAKTAEKAGAEIRYGCAATLDQGPGGWDVLVGPDRIQAAAVLIGSGLGTLPAKIGIRNTCSSRPMIAQQWTQPAASMRLPLGSVELHWLRGGYVGLARPRAGECVVAIACDASESLGESAFDRLRRMNPNAEVWDFLLPDAPRRYGSRGTAGFPWVPDRLGDRNALLIGDAAGYAEPFTGEGIAQALCSAECAVQAIQAGGDVLAVYASLMRRSHHRIVSRTRLIGAILGHPIVQYFVSMRPMLPRRWLSRLVEGVHVRGSL